MTAETGFAADRTVAHPLRIQRKRAKGWRKPEGAVCVTRPGRWANPYPEKVCGSKAEAVRLYREYLAANPELVAAIKSELRGKLLACWCPLDGPCHANVMAEIANGAS